MSLLSRRPTATIRHYATHSRSRLPPSDHKPLLTLEHFLQRKKALDLWRDIARTLRRIPPSPTRTELRTFARAEFERHRGVLDVGHIRYLISTGRTQFDGMKRYVDEQAA